MALPSSRMPKELMEEEAAIKAAKVEEEKRKQLVIRISKTDIFKRCMKEWYDSLNKKEKLRLTPLKLKRRAVYVCAVNDIIYDNLPLDWVDEMRTKCGLKLYQKKKRTHDQAFGGASSAPVAGPSSGSSSLDQNNSEKKRSRRLSKLNASKEDDKTTLTTTPQAAPLKPTVAPKKQTKRFLDLSNDPPPPYWLKCYAEGKVLPRVLTIHSTEDTNILYYDYNPKLQDCFGREVKLTPQPRINLDYLDNLNFVRKVGDKNN